MYFCEIIVHLLVIKEVTR